MAQLGAAERSIGTHVEHGLLVLGAASKKVADVHPRLALGRVRGLHRVGEVLPREHLMIARQPLIAAHSLVALGSGTHHLVVALLEALLEAIVHPRSPKS